MSKRTPSHHTPPHHTTETLRALEEAVRAPGPQLEEADAAVQGHIKGELRGERIRITCMHASPLRSAWILDVSPSHH